MSLSLPEPTDTSHLAPCARCGAMNGISARWCWRCDAGLSADGPALPRTVPSVVFDPPLADDPDLAALTEPPPRQHEVAWEPPVDLLADPFAPSHPPLQPPAQAPHLPASAGTSVARALTEHPPHSDLFRELPPPVLTEAFGSAAIAPASDHLQVDVPLDLQREPAWPFEPPKPRGRRIAGALALGVVVAAGVVGYVQWRDRGLPDLDRLPPTAAGPAAQAPPAAAVAEPPAVAAPVAAASADAAPPRAEPAGARPAAAAPRSPATTPSTARASRPVAGVPAPTGTTAMRGSTQVPSSVAADPPARATGAEATPRAPSDPAPGGCAANVAALGLCDGKTSP